MKSAFAKILGLSAFVAALWGGECFAQTWRGVSDPHGCTWARVKFVNESDQPSNWTVWNGRAAVEATATTAVTDQEDNWDGVVAPGETRYVWIYGHLAGEVNIANTDGGPSTYFPGAHTPVSNGDSELVITIAADGAVSDSLVAGANYAVPSYTGSFNPEN